MNPVLNNTVRDWAKEPARWYEVQGLSMMGGYTDIRPMLAIAVAGYFLWKKFK